jgi:hypothetical protein
MREQQPTPEGKLPDAYELALIRKCDALQVCQKEQGASSCFVCEKLSECTLRREYVEAVYRSMHKDKGGGFEF